MPPTGAGCRGLSTPDSTLGRSRPRPGKESADLAQEVLIVAFREVPRCDRRCEGSFRGWLRRVKPSSRPRLEPGRVLTRTIFQSPNFQPPSFIFYENLNLG